MSVLLGVRRILGVVVVALVIGLAALVIGVATPAWAHGEDPTLVVVLTGIRPTLPPEVLVQVRTGYSEQMVVANPTDIPLTVLDPDGVPFLQVSSAGVIGNLNARYLHLTVNPPDAPAPVPTQARPGAEPRWVSLSPSHTWSWFERRLHPPVAEPPEAPGPPGRPDLPGGPAGRDGTVPQVLASWQVGLRYGDRPVTVTGVLERRPVTGAFHVTTDPRDDQLAIQIGQGALPAVHLQVPPGRTVTVGGLDGIAFLRLDHTGVVVNPASVHFRDNPQFQDRPAGPDGWIQTTATPAATWLDSRLRYPADRPPDDIAFGRQVVEMGRWSIPLTVDGEPRTLTGTIEWVPSAAVSDTPASGFPWVTVGLGAGAAALLAALIALVRRGSVEPRTSTASPPSRGDS